MSALGGEGPRRGPSGTIGQFPGAQYESSPVNGVSAVSAMSTDTLVFPLGGNARSA